MTDQASIGSTPDQTHPTTPSDPCAPASGGDDIDRLHGHWVLAKLGKKVLRPGGLELTRQLLEHAAPTSDDAIVEFGPGLGKTAETLLAANPASYIGIDPNDEGEAQLLKVLKPHNQARLVKAEAAETRLDDNSATLVVGEAMLSMCSPRQKAEIVSEAFRILKPGGRYAIHELGLTHIVDMDDDERSDTSKDISKAIRVSARPLTIDAWVKHLEGAGFEIRWRGTAPMRLLEPRRIVADEGLGGALRFMNNLRKNPRARERVLAMRASFKRQKDALIAVGFVAVKPEG